jgi:hypothetical protein
VNPFGAARAVTVVIALGVLLGACPSPGGTPAEQAGDSPVASPSSGPTATAGSSGPLTEAEIAWIQAVQNMVERMAIGQAPPVSGTADKNELRAQARTLRRCGSDLAAIGVPPTARLVPAQELIAKACDRYNLAATCYTTLADAPTQVSQKEMRKINEAVTCITAASTEAAAVLLEGLNMLNALKGFPAGP